MYGHNRWTLLAVLVFCVTLIICTTIVSVLIGRHFSLPVKTVSMLDLESPDDLLPPETPLLPPVALYAQLTPDLTPEDVESSARVMYLQLPSVESAPVARAIAQNTPPVHEDNFTDLDNEFNRWLAARNRHPIPEHPFAGMWPR